LTCERNLLSSLTQFNNVALYEAEASIELSRQFLPVNSVCVDLNDVHSVSGVVYQQILVEFYLNQYTTVDSCSPLSISSISSVSDSLTHSIFGCLCFWYITVVDYEICSFFLPVTSHVLYISGIR